MKKIKPRRYIVNNAVRLSDHTIKKVKPKEKIPTDKYGNYIDRLACE